MNIREANNKIEKIENEINYLLTKKENILAYKANSQIVINPKAISRTTKYIYDNSCKEVDDKIDLLYEERKTLLDFLKQSLKIIDEYDEVKRQIIILRETTDYNWFQISLKVNYCETLCRNVYREYKKKRDI